MEKESLSLRRRVEMIRETIFGTEFPCFFWMRFERQTHYIILSGIRVHAILDQNGDAPSISLAECFFSRMEVLLMMLVAVFLSLLFSFFSSRIELPSVFSGRALFRSAGESEIEVRMYF